MVVENKSEEFATRLNQLLDAAGAPGKNVGRGKWFHKFVKNTLQINVSYEASRKWLSGESIPYTKRLGKIAKGLNSTTEFLIGEESKNTANSDISQHTEVKEPIYGYLTDSESKLLKLFRQLDEEHQNHILASVLLYINSPNPRNPTKQTA